MWKDDLKGLVEAVRLSWNMQSKEGMEPLPQDVPGAIAWKYCGGGFGGYAAYFFPNKASRDAACQRKDFRPIEPWIRNAERS